MKFIRILVGLLYHSNNVNNHVASFTFQNSRNIAITKPSKHLLLQNTKTSLPSTRIKTPKDGNFVPVEQIENDLSYNNETKEASSGLLWRGVVLFLCMLWASNFAAAKLVMSEPGVDSSLYALSRFSIAAIALLPGSILKIRDGVLDWNTAKNAAICGSWVAFGYLGQTIGLLTTTASRSCVICTLHCVFVAIIAEIMRVSKSFDYMRLLPAAIAVAGVAVIELKGAGGPPTIGDLLSFSQPIGFGLGYLQLEELMKQRPQAALPVSCIKLIMVAIASFFFFQLSHNGISFHLPDFTPILSSPVALTGILYTGLITTAFALWIESIAFKRVPATDASIILTTEPLFAALASAYYLGETFVLSDYVGALLILGACVYSILLEDD